MKSKKKKVEPEILETPWQKQVRARIEELATRPYQPYTGRRFAEYPFRDTLKSALSQYISRTEPALYGLAQSELQKTLSGEYNPATSPYYEAFRKEALREEQDALNRLRRAAQLGGMLYSTPTQQAEARLIADTTNRLATLLGQLAEAERVRRLQSVPTAISVGEFLSQSPLRTAQAITAISPLLKAIEEEPLEFEYQQFKEGQMWPYTVQTPLLQTLLGYAPWYYPVYTKKPSLFERITGAVGSIMPFMNFGSSLLGSTLGLAGSARAYSPLGMIGSYPGYRYF